MKTVPTPTPTPLRSDLAQLLDALPNVQPGAARVALRSAVLSIFDLALNAGRAESGPALPTSDTNGSHPAAVEQRLFDHEPIPASYSTTLDPPQAA